MKKPLDYVNIYNHNFIAHRTKNGNIILRNGETRLVIKEKHVQGVISALNLLHNWEPR